MIILEDVFAEDHDSSLISENRSFYNQNPRGIYFDIFLEVISKFGILECKENLDFVVEMFRKSFECLGFIRQLSVLFKNKYLHDDVLLSLIPFILDYLENVQVNYEENLICHFLLSLNITKGIEIIQKIDKKKKKALLLSGNLYGYCVFDYSFILALLTKDLETYLEMVHFNMHIKEVIDKYHKRFTFDERNVKSFPGNDRTLLLKDPYVLFFKQFIENKCIECLRIVCYADENIFRNYKVYYTQFINVIIENSNSMGEEILTECLQDLQNLDVFILHFNNLYNILHSEKEIPKSMERLREWFEKFGEKYISMIVSSK